MSTTRLTATTKCALNSPHPQSTERDKDTCEKTVLQQRPSTQATHAKEAHNTRAAFLAWHSQVASVLRRMFAGSFRNAAVLLLSSSMTRLSAETSG